MRLRLSVVSVALSVIGVIMLAATPTVAAKPGKPHVTVAPQPGDSADFGQVVIGDTKTQTFIVTSDGTRKTPHLVVRLHDSSAFEITADECRKEKLPQGESCLVTVTYAPTTAQDDASSLVVTSRNKKIRASISLTGTGISFTPLAQLTLTPTTHDFGKTSGTFTFTAMNTGNVPLTVWSGMTTSSPFMGAVVQFSHADFSACIIAHDEAGTPLAVGASCTIDATFTQAPPTGSPECFDNGVSALFDWEYYAAGSPAIAGLVEGTATATGVICNPAP